MRQRQLTLLAAVGILSAACGGAPAADTQGAEPAVEPVGGTEAATSSPQSGCPDLGDLVATYDASGTPLAFNFGYPAGFEVTKSQDMGSLYQLDLRRSVEIDGDGEQVYFSIIQTLQPEDGPTPRQIQILLDRPSLAESMGELAPQEAGEAPFGDQTIPLFRIQTEDKTVYKFNVPHHDGYYNISVEFAPALGAAACLQEMREVAEAWVQTLEPNPAADISG